MASVAPHRDSHAAPPRAIRDSYKRYQHMSLADVDQDPDILDFTKPQSLLEVTSIATISCCDMIRAFYKFAERDNDLANSDVDTGNDCLVYEHSRFPGIETIQFLSGYAND